MMVVVVLMVVGGEGVVHRLASLQHKISDAALMIKVWDSAAAACMTDRAEVKSAWRC